MIFKVKLILGQPHFRNIYNDENERWGNQLEIRKIAYMFWMILIESPKVSLQSKKTVANIQSFYIAVFVYKSLPIIGFGESLCNVVS